MRATIQQMIEAADREVKQRERVYKRLVESGKMTQKFADEQTQVMRDIADFLRELSNRPEIAQRTGQLI